MHPITLEYIAGFVDGEGTFTIRTSRLNFYRPVFAICNTNKQVIEDIRRYFSIPGKISLMHHNHPKFLTAYQISTSDISLCKSIALLLEPYLTVKKEQAQIITRFPKSLHPPGGGRKLEDFSTNAYAAKLRKRIRYLNRGGPTAKELNDDLESEPDPQGSLFELNTKESA